MINPGSKACQVNPLDGSARPMPDIDKEPPIYGESMLHGAYQAWHIKKMIDKRI